MRNDLQAAVNRFEERVKANNRSIKNGKTYGIPIGRAELEFYEDMSLALAALRDAQARQEGCECCVDNKEQFFAASAVDKVTKSKYCGLCGRRLEGGE